MQIFSPLYINIAIPFLWNISRKEMSQKFKAGNKRAYWINISVHKTKMSWNASISLSPSLCQPNFASRFSTAYPIFSVTSLAQPLHLTHSIISLHVEVVALIIVCDVNRVRRRSRIPFVGARYTPVCYTFRKHFDGHCSLRMVILIVKIQRFDLRCLVETLHEIV